jgi:hypothetical protein
VDLYIHPRIRLNGVVLNYINTWTTLLYEILTDDKGMQHELVRKGMHVNYLW